jgi:hypothetical protein
VNVQTEEQSKQWMHTHSPIKPKKFLTNVACQKAGPKCFLGQERSADGGIYTTRGRHNFRSVLHNTKKQRMAIQKKSRGMLTYSVVLLHDNARSHTALALQHCWSISTGSCLTTLLSALISL